MVATPRLDRLKSRSRKMPQRDQRLVPVGLLPEDERGHEPDTAGQRPPDPRRPVVGLPFLQGEDDHEHAEAGQQHAEQIEAVLLGGQVGNQPEGQPQADDSDRDVDEEDPLPAEPVDQDTAGQRSDQSGDPGRGTPHAHRHPAPLGGEDPGDRGQRLRGEQRRADTLQYAGGDQHADGVGETAPQRRGREHRQAEQVEVLRPEAVAESARQQQRHRKAKQIGAGHPDHRVVAGVQLLHDGRVRHCHDRRVDQDHEEADHHGPQRMPRVLARKPAVPPGRREPTRRPTPRRRGHIPTSFRLPSMVSSSAAWRQRKWPVRSDSTKPRSQVTCAWVDTSK